MKRTFAIRCGGSKRYALPCQNPTINACGCCYLHENQAPDLIASGDLVEWPEGSGLYQAARLIWRGLPQGNGER